MTCPERIITHGLLLPRMGADSLPAKGWKRRIVPKPATWCHVVLTLFISRIPVWAEGGVGKLWRFDCPEYGGMGRDLGRIIASPNPCE